MHGMPLRSENAWKKLLQNGHRDGALRSSSFAFACSEGFSAPSMQTRLLAEVVQHSSCSLFPSFLAVEVVCADEQTGSTLQHSHNGELLVSEKLLKPLEMNAPVERMLNGVCANLLASAETNAVMRICYFTLITTNNNKKL